MGIVILFKNVYKSFLSKKFQLLAVAIIIFLASFIYTAMFLTTSSLQLKVDEYSSDYEIEDFSITMLDILVEDDLEQINQEILTTNFNYTLTQLKNINVEEYYKVIDNRINLIENKYPSDYNLMLREGKDLVFGDYNIRAYYDSDDINLTYVESGRKPLNDNEICLNKTFLNNHNLSIGDKIILESKEYDIVGSILYVDYSLALIGNQILIDMENSGVALFSDAELDDLQGVEFRYLSGVYVDENTFKEEVLDLYNEDQLDLIENITLTKNQIRSGAIIEEIKGGQAMTLGLAIIISLLAVLTVAIITYKMLSGERKQIGLLKAIGYRNSEIALPYIVLITILSLPMLLLGYFIGINAASHLKGLYLTFYMLPDAVIETNYTVLLTAIIVPFIFIIGLSYIVIKQLLNKNALSLLKLSDKAEATKLNKFTNKILRKSKATTRFKFSYLTQSLGKLLVFIIGIFSASSLFIMAVMFYGFSDRMINDYYNSKDYQYEGIVDFSKELPVLKDGEEKYLDGQVFIDDEAIVVKAVETDNELFNIYRKDINITTELENGAIINSALAISLNLKKGDIINISFKGKEKTIEIVEISDNAIDKTMYLNRSVLGELYGDTNLYSGIYSKNELTNDYKLIIDKQDILDLSNSMNEFINIAMGILLAISMIISILILYILTTLTVEDNFYSISLLKVMGYSRKEVRSMILNAYLTYSIFAYIIAIPITVVSLDYLIKYFAEYYNMYMSFELSYFKALLGLLLIILVFYIGSYQATKEIRNISLQEVLKEYQE